MTHIDKIKEMLSEVGLFPAQHILDNVSDVLMEVYSEGYVDGNLTVDPEKN